jgi:hypothetical protein
MARCAGTDFLKDYDGNFIRRVCLSACSIVYNGVAFYFLGRDEAGKTLRFSMWGEGVLQLFLYGRP